MGHPLYKEEVIEYFPLLLFGGGHRLQGNAKAFRIRQCNVKKISGHIEVNHTKVGNT